VEATGLSRSDDSEDRSTRRGGGVSFFTSTAGDGAWTRAGAGVDFEMMGCDADLGIPTLALAIFSLEGLWPGCRLYGWNA